VVTPSGDVHARCALVRAGRWNGFDVFTDPTLPIGAAELRCGDQVVRIRYIGEPQPRP